MRQRRRAERGHFATSRDRSQPVVARRDIENRQRKLLFIGAGVALGILVLILGVGWFLSSFQPPRRTVATIAGNEIKLREVVAYTALATVRGSGTLRPDLALNDLVRDRVVSARAADLGVIVTDEEIDRSLAASFEPVPPGSTQPADTLTEAGRSSLDLFLSAIAVSEDQYRGWLAGNLYVIELQDFFRDQQPDVAEQVFVEWIVTASTNDGRTAIGRIVDEGEDFGTVADDLNTEFVLAGPGGEVGWVPQGAIPELDPVLFGPELELNTVIGPLSTSLGSIILRVTDGPAEQPLSDLMREFVAADEFQDWLDDAVNVTLETPVSLSIGDFEWVIDQIV